MQSENVPDIDRPTVEIDGREWRAENVVDFLRHHITDRRKERIRQVVDERTHTVVPVVEGLYDMGNVSAVLRSAEALGYYSVHVVETSERFKNSSRTSSGAEKWLDIHRWQKPADCYTQLKDDGYQLAVTHLDGSVPLSQIDFTRPTAVVFGNEAEGVSEETLAHADYRCQIPMVGFVQSYNVSVAAALTLFHAHRERTNELGRQGDLSPEEKLALTARYYIRSVTKAEQILRRYIE